MDFRGDVVRGLDARMMQVGPDFEGSCKLRKKTLVDDLCKRKLPDCFHTGMYTASGTGSGSRGIEY